jgi:hypothetical protein
MYFTALVIAVIQSHKVEQGMVFREFRLLKFCRPSQLTDFCREDLK